MNRTEDIPKTGPGATRSLCWWSLGSFGIILAFLVPQMNRGLFIEDTGYHMYEAHQAFHLYGSPDMFYWLTSYLAGMWMSLSPSSMSCYWSALGGSLLAAATAVAAALLTMSMFKVRAGVAFPLAILAAMLQLHLIHDFHIHYYTLPFFAAELMLLFYFKARSAGTPKTAAVWLAFSALAAASLSGLRITCICLAAIPAIHELCHGILNKNIRWKAICSYCAMLAGFLVVFLCLFLWWKSCFPEFGYEDALREHIGHPVLELIAKHFKLIAFCSVTPLLATILLLLPRYTGRIPGSIRISCLVLAAAAALVPLLHLGFHAWQGTSDSTAHEMCTMYNRHSSRLAFILAFLALIPGKPGLVFNTAESTAAPRQNGVEYRLNLLMVGCLALFYPLGSDTGLMKVSYCLPLVIPALLVTLRDHMGYSRALYGTILGIWATAVLCIWPGNVDIHSNQYLNRLQCTTPYTTPLLAGMYETPERVKAQEEAISAIQAYSAKDEEILFLLRTYEVLAFSGRRSWMHPLFHISPFEKSNFQSYVRHKGMPRVAVAPYVPGKPDTWERTLLAPYYDKVYTGESGPMQMFRSNTPHKFAIWVLKEDSRFPVQEAGNPS